VIGQRVTAVLALLDDPPSREWLSRFFDDAWFVKRLLLNRSAEQQQLSRIEPFNLRALDPSQDGFDRRFPLGLHPLAESFDLFGCFLAELFRLFGKTIGSFVLDLLDLLREASDYLLMLGTFINEHLLEQFGIVGKIVNLRHAWDIPRAIRMRQSRFAKRSTRPTTHDFQPAEQPQQLSALNCHSMVLAC
jgi:hypothetical protein